MEQKPLTKPQQLQALKEIFEAMNGLQAEIPGKYFGVLEQVKNAVALVNNSISAEAITLDPESQKTLTNGEVHPN